MSIKNGTPVIVDRGLPTELKGTIAGKANIARRDGTQCAVYLVELERAIGPSDNGVFVSILSAHPDCVLVDMP